MNLTRLSLPLTATFLLLSPSFANAQLFKGNKLLDKIKNATSGIDNASWKPGAAISTSIKDSLPGFRILDDTDFIAMEADTINTFSLTPGYYRTTIRSYCLHAGVYGASKGNGYQIAHLKGNQATLVNAILQRTATHPEIAQTDVQLLIWGIEAGQKFTDYEPDFQLRIKPLLTEKDIAAMEVKISSLTEKLVPGSVKDMLNTYELLRSKMNKAQMNYDDIEKVAVKAGIPPTGLGTVEIKKGLWSYIGNGFFIRVYPQSYSTTDIEIYRPGYFVVKKDDKGRITSFTRGTESVTIEYDDTQGADIATNAGHPSIPVWRFRKFTYVNTAKGISEEIRNKGWILRGTTDELDRSFATVISEASVTDIYAARGPYYSEETTAKNMYHGDSKESINWGDLYNRYKDAQSKYKNAKDAVEWAERINNADKIKNHDEYLSEKAAQERITKGLKAASNPTDFKNKAAWIADLLKMNRDLMYWIDCQLAGTCNNNNDPSTPDLPSNVGQPGDAAAQRLGLSPVKKSPMYKL
ncbi:MAG: hypothetical protein J0I41_19365 [Filimonas sp.]|nr:hypothetical protein [Filimonas sp.]